MVFLYNGIFPASGSQRETDGNRNLDRAAEGLFITHSSQEDGRGASWKEKSQSSSTVILSPGFVLPFVKRRKTFVFLRLSHVRMLITPLK